MSLTVSIVFFFIGSFLTFLTLWRELKTSKEWTWFKTILVITLGAFVIVGICDTVNKSQDSQKDVNRGIDTTKKESKSTRDIVKSTGNTTDTKLEQGFGKTGKKLDSVGNKIRKIPTPYALLEFSTMGEGEPNPFFQKPDKNNNYFALITLISNWGTGFAYNLNGTMHLVDEGANGLYLVNIPHQKPIK